MNPTIDTTDKTTLRKRLRRSRRELGEQAQRQAAEKLLVQLLQLPEFVASRRVAMYLANDGEISPERVVQWMHANSRQCLLPIVQQDRGRNWLLFAEIKPDTEYTKNRFGIFEPVVEPDMLLRADQLDMVLLPLVGFDGAGNRIGMGGGFYDTTFEFARDPQVKSPVMIGLAHECQKVGTIEAERWDIPLSIVVTDQNIYSLAQ